MSHHSVSHKTNFIQKIIDEDLASGKHQSIVTRFPPEPNGYLHVGHAKAICINFGLAKAYNGKCFLRFDDTNPCHENEEYKQAIESDIQWLGFKWDGHFTSTSNYFDEVYRCAMKLIQKGKAYVCGLDSEQMREYRGTLTEPGKNSPDRDRSIEENISLFEGMKNGQYSEGQYTLRAKIDMASGNINLRDPIIYRIRKVSHHATLDKWCIYPMYDFSHPLSDALEGITHSLCSLEFQDHRPLYDWFIAHCEMQVTPRQIEFSRLNLSNIVTSKRKLKTVVEAHKVDGWDDPRMPTLSGLRRRGFTPDSIKNLCEQVGVSKQDSVIDLTLLEEALRDELNQSAQRRMAVLRPIKVTLTNLPQEQELTIYSSNHPQRPELGKRELQFTRELYIDSDDFMIDPLPGYFRLAPQKRVRLINAYVIQCNEVIHDAKGNVTELKCEYLPETLAGKKPADGAKVKGVIHWVSAKYALRARIRLYDRLFEVENPGKSHDILSALNTHSLESLDHAFVEPSLNHVPPETHFQFNRLGYFCSDRFDHNSENPTFNRAVSLRDTWKK